MANPSEPQKTYEFQNVDQTDLDQENAVQRAAEESGKSAKAAGRKEQDAFKAAATRAAAAPESNVIRDATQRFARQSAEVIRFGLHAVTEVQAPLIEAGEKHSRRLVDQISHVTDMYYDAAAQTAPNALALVESYYAFSRGVQKNQNASLTMLRGSMDGLFHRREALSQVDSPAEFARIQGDVYLDTLNSLFKGYTTLWQNLAQITQDTLEPLKAPRADQ